MKRKSKKKQKRECFNWHHILPTSRFKRLVKERIHIHIVIKKLVKKRLHIAWHNLFANMFPHEALDQVKKWTTKQGLLTKKLGGSKLKAWKIVFGEKTLPKEAIEIIKRHWSIPEEVLYQLLNLLLPKEIIEVIKREQSVSEEDYQ